MPKLKIALVCDLLEENWPSMDLVAYMLVERLEKDHGDRAEVTKICPVMKKRAGLWSWAFGLSDTQRFNADRFLNRFWDYPRFLRKVRKDFDLFHLVDHSYSQLLHILPPERTIVTCHDLDTFQSLLHPEQEPRSIYFKAMMERTLSGLRKAAFVACDSVATRDELLAHNIASPERSAVVRLGIHPSCSPEVNVEADREAAELLQESEIRSQESVSPHPNPLPKGDGTVDLLHVGSTIPRKRIDVLLRIFAEVKKRFSRARLLRIGGAFTEDQDRLVQQLNLRDSIVVLPKLDRDVLAAIYRRAALVLLTSEREGFGLPVVEAMACGTPVVASALPVLREVGGEAASYCSIDRIDSWRYIVSELLTERSERPDRWAERKTRSIAQAAKFSWTEYANTMVGIYQEVLSSSVARAKLLTAEDTEKSKQLLETARV